LILYFLYGHGRNFLKKIGKIMFRALKNAGLRCMRAGFQAVVLDRCGLWFVADMEAA
jgi:hypothetical protein